MLTKLKHLVNVSGISGREQAIAAKISEYMTPICDKVYTDAMGSLIAYKKGTGEQRRRIMLVAHMDEIGFVVTSIEKSGMLRIAPIGGIHFSASAFSEVVFENGQSGVLVPEAGVKPNDWTYDKMLVDIGAKDARDAEKRVAVGDFFSVVPNVIKLSARRIAGRPLDDRIGCAIMIEIAERLTEQPCEDDVYFVFTVQEEVGVRGAGAAAEQICPDYCINFDVTATGDVPGAKPMACELGGGAAIKVKDSSVLCHKGVVDRLVKVAKEKGFKYQYEILTAGGTDTSAVQKSGVGVKVGALSIPTRYIHSGVEMIDLGDTRLCVEIALAYLHSAKKD